MMNAIDTLERFAVIHGKHYLLERDLYDTKVDGKYVYIIQLWNTDIFKIGFTSNLNRRLSQLQSKCPVPLKIIFNWWGHDYRIFEWALHKSFEKKRIRGEWFRLTQEDLIWITDTYQKQYSLAIETDKN